MRRAIMVAALAVSFIGMGAGPAGAAPLTVTSDREVLYSPHGGMIQNGFDHDDEWVLTPDGYDCWFAALPSADAPNADQVPRIKVIGTATLDVPAKAVFQTNCEVSIS
ncbi:hypothetical protein ACIP5Y_39515 [Nocardia sp. NPDC088792]|uniref:hypothetical protein n=1 Tax=Nocardia sp. NPDC088792 TaxID=3364332 RepID=UPI00381C2BA6